MTLKVMFVYLNILGIPYIDQGIASLSATLKNHGYEVTLLDFTFGLKNKKAFKKIKKFKPNVLLINSRSNEFQKVVKFSEFVKKNTITLIFCGGIHPTTAPREAISYDCFDGICLGEGEYALLDLLKKIENKENYLNTKNFWFKQNTKIIKNPVYPLIHDLDKIPFPDLELFDLKKYLKARDGQLDIVSARGCPFRCSYCVNHILQDLYKSKGTYTRTYSIETIVANLNKLRKKYLIKSIYFQDETFNLDHKRLKKFCEVYKKEINLPFECDLRADYCTEEIFDWLKQANCTKVNIAIESGDPVVREKLLSKKISDEQIINAFKFAKKFGIHTMSFNIIGLPFETKEQIQKTIDLNKKVEADSIQVSIFTPYPNTNMYNYCKEHNLIQTEKLGISYYTNVYLKNPFISKKELLKIRKRFAYNCYKNRSKFKAFLLLLREESTPYYLKYGHLVPIWFNHLIYKLIWHSKLFKFLSK